MVVCHGDGFLDHINNKKEGYLKNYLQFEVNDVNDQNKYGETLIFTASYFCEYDVVTNLLNLGADPNIPNISGNTSLHAAAYFGNLKLLQLLVDSGGDLRILNNDGFRPIQLMKNYKNQRKLKSYEHNLFINLMNHLSEKISHTVTSPRKLSVFYSFPKIKSFHSIRPYYSYISGFGNFCWKNKKIEGLQSYVSIIYDSKDLTKEIYSPIYNYGNDIILCNKLWKNEKVTVKLVKSLPGKDNMLCTRDQILANHLIKEAQIIGSIRHPNVLLLMSVNLLRNDFIPTVYYQLVFERAKLGTLHNLLHVKKEKLQLLDVKKIFDQVISAVQFVHSQNMIHCSLSSYAIYLLDMNNIKLGNFEYALDSRSLSNSKSHTISQNQMIDTVYKWLAPELLHTTQSISTATDVYGISLVIWETFCNTIPHINKTFRNIVTNYQFPFDNTTIHNVPSNMRSLLNTSMAFEPTDRPRLQDLSTLISEVILTNSLLRDDTEHIYMEINKNKFKSPPENLHRELSIVMSNKTELPVVKDIRKSSSFNCLSPIKHVPESESESTYSLKRFHHRRDSFVYKEFAALPTHNDQNECVWNYPGPQTEFAIEGQGNLSNDNHRASITRGMKPASHQTGLTTSHTNICSLLGTTDLIQSSSRTNLYQKYDTLKSTRTISSGSTNKSLFSTPYKLFKSPSTNKSSPKSPKIAGLIEKYEKCPSHPYSSSSNNSSPNNPILKKTIPSASNELANQFKRPKNFLSPISNSLSTKSSITKNFFPFSRNISINKNEQQHLHPTTDEDDDDEIERDLENCKPTNKLTVTSKSKLYKFKLFGDATNRRNYDN